MLFSRRVYVLLAMLAAFAWLPSTTFAHEVRPAVLELLEVDPGIFEASWKVPAIEDKMLSLSPRFGASCRGGNDIKPRITGGAAVAHFRLVCPLGLAASTISINNLSRVMTDVIVRVEFLNGQVVNQRLEPAHPSFIVPRASSFADVFRTYLQLGIEHILFGFDHLLFIFGLVLLVRSGRRILMTASAFTIAHSITLSLAALGLVNVPVPPVEALIALSIALVAVELYRAAQQPDKILPSPWILAFGFGLLHGLGFASALAGIGLPNHEIPGALLAFNVGVELGQIGWIAAILVVGRLIDALRPAWRYQIYWGSTYATGGLASFWLIQRLAAF